MKILYALLLTFIITTSAPKLMAQDNQTRPQLNHLAILTTDLKKSTEFYKDIIGLEIAEEPFKDGRHTWFSLGGGAHLHIIMEPDSKDSHRKNNHLCFAVPSVEAFAKKLNEHKIRFENVPGVAGAITTRTDGVKQIYFQDPDGYWIEINDAK